MTAGAIRQITLVVPVQTFCELQRHQDDMLREFALIEVDRLRGGATDVPARLLDIVTDLRSRFASPRGALLEQVAAAAERGEDLVTVTISVPVAAASAVKATCEAFEEADEFCRSGDLLTLAASPEVAALRRALCETIVDQLSD